MRRRAVRFLEATLAPEQKRRQPGESRWSPRESGAAFMLNIARLVKNSRTIPGPAGKFEPGFAGTDAILTSEMRNTRCEPYDFPRSARLELQ